MNRYCIALVAMSALVAAGPARAFVFCATTGTQLSQALIDVGGNGQADSIRIATGVFSSASGFNYVNSENFDLTVTGGWNSTCLAQTLNASLTVLDGQDLRRVLSFHPFASSANVTVKNLTLRNGNTVALGDNGSGAGLTVVGSVGYSGNVLIESVIIEGNTTARFGAAANVGADLGSITLRNVLARANLAQGVNGNVGAIDLVNNGTATNIINCTVVGNSADVAGRFGGLRLGGSAPYTLSNNIFWGNDTTDVFADTIGSPTVMNNDIGAYSGAMAPGSSGNVNVDPRFYSATNLRLRAESTLIDAGLDAPVGGLAATDISGAVRVVGAHVDIGAYESNDRIFRHGFE